MAFIDRVNIAKGGIISKTWTDALYYNQVYLANREFSRFESIATGQTTASVNATPKLISGFSDVSLVPQVASARILLMAVFYCTFTVGQTLLFSWGIGTSPAPTASTGGNTAVEVVSATVPTRIRMFYLYTGGTQDVTHYFRPLVATSGASNTLTLSNTYPASVTALEI